MDARNDTSSLLIRAASEDTKLTLLNFSAAEIAPLTIYCLVMVFFGLAGNGTVLYSSLRYNAIRLDKVSLMFVQNLATADILYTVIAILPQLITYIAGEWVLGKVYCFISAQLSVIPASTNTFTVLLITTYRLWLVTHPFSDVPKKLTVRVVVAITWVLATAGTVISLAYRSSSIFSQTNGKCTSGVYVNKEAGGVLKIAVGVIVLIPMFVITVANITLSVIAVRSSRRQASSNRNYKALVMVCALSGLFILSWVPYIIFTFLKSKYGNVSRAVDLMGFHCTYLNSFGNPILYTLTNKRFGLYVRKLLTTIFCHFCANESPDKDGGEQRMDTNSSNVKAASSIENGVEQPTIKPDIED